MDGLGQGDDIGAANKHGFDYFFGYADQVHAHNYYPAFLWKNDQKFLLPNVMPKNEAWTAGQGVAGAGKKQDITAAERGVELIGAGEGMAPVATRSITFFGEVAQILVQESQGMRGFDDAGAGGALGLG